MSISPVLDDAIEIVNLNASLDEDSGDITLNYRGHRLNVSVFASSSPEENKRSKENELPLEDRLCRLINQATNTDSNEDYEDIMNRVVEIILSVGKSEFLAFISELPIASSGVSQQQSLHSHLYPDVLNFCIRAINGQATCLPIGEDETNTMLPDPPVPDDDGTHNINSELIQCSAKDVTIINTFVWGTSITCHAQVDGKDMFCKASQRGASNQDIAKELEALDLVQKISGENPTTLIRIPKLLGYVRHSNTGGVIGFLREWIPSGRYGVSLQHVAALEVPRATREKWVSQIRSTLDILHKNGGIWEDAKASNVVVDSNDDAWLIDFGGGWTEGWVDSGLAGTVDGDLQGFQKIVEFLDLD